MKKRLTLALGLVLALVAAFIGSLEAALVTDAAEAVLDTIRTRRNRKVRDQVKEN